MYKKIKIVRVVISLIVFVLFFLSFTFIAREFVFLFEALRFQFMPSLLAFFSGGALIFVIFVLLTLVFGRVYCSFICPLGIMQDVISRIASIFKTKKRKRTIYSNPKTILRLVILFTLIVTLIIGNLYLAILSDPYSNYGRIVSQLFDPILRLINNGAAMIFPESIYYRPFSQIVVGSFLWSCIFFLVILLMSAFRGRLFCNTICPVGTLLGSLSRVSLLKLSIDNDKCTSCHACSRYCKSECIDVKARVIDHSRCVMCYNCTTVCTDNAIAYKLRYDLFKGNRKKEPTPRDIRAVEMNGRREALAVLGGVTATLISRDWAIAKCSVSDTKIGGILPPGAISFRHFTEHCTSCSACVEACPSQIIRPSSGEYGLAALFQPVINYKKHFCGYDCNACTLVCPTGAIMPLTLAAKQLTRIGEVRFYRNRCIVVRDETDCGACDEHCPTKAITMVAWKNGLRIPSVNEDLCIGCGGCEYICPVNKKAMIVHPLSIHEVAQAPLRAIQQQKEVTDFGF